MKQLYELRWETPCGRLCYIGSSKDPSRRLSQHRAKAVAGAHHSPRVSEAWTKYGDPELVVLAVLEDEEAHRVEDLWIQRMEGDPALLNSSKRARSSRDPHIRQRMLKTRSRNPKWRRNQREATSRANRKGVLLFFPGGARRTFTSVTQAARHLGVAQATLSRWLLGADPWPGEGRRLNRSLYPLIGLRGEFTDISGPLNE